MGEATFTRRLSFAVSAKTIQFGGEGVGALQPLVINQETVKHLRRLRVFAISRLLRKHPSQLNDFDKALIASIHWFSNAQRQSEIETAFQSLITAIEALLTPRDGAPIGSALAENVALLLGKGVDGRKIIKRRFRQLYGIRSGVSHGGGKVVTERDYNELEQIAGALIVVLTQFTGKMASRQDLLDKLEDVKLGGKRLRVS